MAASTGRGPSPPSCGCRGPVMLMSGPQPFGESSQGAFRPEQVGPVGLTKAAPRGQGRCLLGAPDPVHHLHGPSQSGVLEGQRPGKLGPANQRGRLGRWADQWGSWVPGAQLVDSREEGDTCAWSPPFVPMRPQLGTSPGRPHAPVISAGIRSLFLGGQDETGSATAPKG